MASSTRTNDYNEFVSVKDEISDVSQGKLGGRVGKINVQVTKLQFTRL